MATNTSAAPPSPIISHTRRTAPPQKPTTAQRPQPDGAHGMSDGLEDELLQSLNGRARVATASAGGGGRARRQRGHREGRPRLSRRERRAVNDLLLQQAPGRPLDAKAELDAPARAPTPFRCLLLVPPETPARSLPVAGRARTPAPDRRVRMAVKRKGAPVTAVLRAVEERVRRVRPGETLALAPGGALARLVCHAVAQFYGLSHCSVGAPPHRGVSVTAPVEWGPLPHTRLVDILA